MFGALLTGLISFGFGGLSLSRCGFMLSDGLRAGWCLSPWTWVMDDVLDGCMGGETRAEEGGICARVCRGGY